MLWPFRNVHHQLPSTEAAIERHLAALSKMVDNNTHQKIFDHLYGSLSILDSKSASLLQFNSVLIAVFTIFVSVQSRPLLWILGGPGLAMTLCSCYLLLSVVWVHWSTTDHLVEGRMHATKLLQVRRDRTISYRRAWNLSIAAVLALLGVVIHSAYFRLLAP